LLDESCLVLTKGQYLDLSFDVHAPEVLDRYLEMIQSKTASLVAASAAIGALSAGAPNDTITGYKTFGHHLGMAFQILDDVLGTWGSEDNLGKPVGADVETRKPSYPPMYALHINPDFGRLWNNEETSNDEIMAALDESGARDAAHDAAAEQTSLAFDSLTSATPSEPAASELRKLADRLLVRQS
jgi:geranylgeranyl diphosphate synthase type I